MKIPKKIKFLIFAGVVAWFGRDGRAQTPVVTNPNQFIAFGVGANPSAVPTWVGKLKWGKLIPSMDGKTYGTFSTDVVPQSNYSINVSTVTAGVHHILFQWNRIAIVTSGDLGFATNGVNTGVAYGGEAGLVVVVKQYPTWGIAAWTGLRSLDTSLTKYNFAPMGGLMLTLK